MKPFRPHRIARRQHGAPRPRLARISRVATVACLLAATANFGTIGGSFAIGLALGTSLFTIANRQMPRCLRCLPASLLLAVVTLLCLVVVPVRIVQSVRAWCPREQTYVCLRRRWARLSIHSGDLIAYRVPVDTPLVSLGIVAALPGQTCSIGAEKLRVDDASVPTTRALRQLLQRCHPSDHQYTLREDEFIVLPLDLTVRLEQPGDDEQLAHDLPKMLIIHETAIVGHAWNLHRSKEPIWPGE